MIGDAIRKYQAQKAAEAAEEAVEAAAEAAAQEEALLKAAISGEVVRPAHAPPSATVDPTIAAVLSQMGRLIEQLAAQAKASDSSVEKDAAYRQIELIEKLITKTQPENVHHPGISAFSYPEGDQAHPKPDLQCKIFWVGYELRTETLTPQEIDLLNRLKPGEYRVTKSDMTSIPFRVTAKHSDKVDAQGKPAIETLEVWFSCKGENKQNHLSMVSYLQQVLGDRVPTSVELLAELARMKRELEDARRGVVGVV